MNWSTSTSLKSQHVVQILGHIFYNMSLLYQYRYSRLHRSVYGISYDLHILDAFSTFCSIYLYLNYLLSPLALSQYMQRYPLFFLPKDSLEVHELPLSHALFLLHVVRFVLSLRVLSILYKFRKTRHVHQSFSKLCRCILLCTVLFHVFTFACARLNIGVGFFATITKSQENFAVSKNRNMGKYGVFYIDHLLYVWILQNYVLDAFKLMPQLILNFSGCCTQGLSSKYVVFQGLAHFLTATALLHNMFADVFYQKWYTIPFNYQPFFTSLMNFLLILVILYQAQYLYNNSMPTLIKYSDHIKKSNVVRSVYPL